MPNNILPAWTALTRHAQTMAQTHIPAPDQARFAEMNLKIPGLLLDYSRQRMGKDAMALLMALARECDVSGWCARMFAGEKINESEKRAVLHTALRRPAGGRVMVDGRDVMQGVHETLARMEKFVRRIHDGTWTGHGGKPIRTVVNIGIGGSDLGPRMVVSALRNFRVQGMDVRFVSNVDDADIYNALQGLDPGTTLFLIASKTFTTQETMTNARTARGWIFEHFGTEAAIEKHFIALSTNGEAVHAFGISPENMFPFADWVGGRFSLWSPIGMAIALALGFENFRALLGGAHAMDLHFETAPLARNMPVLLALLGVWNRNFLGMGNLAVLPYSQNLALFPKWLQQTDMESNGKSVTRSGEVVPYKTGPVIFGTAGTDCQHSYFQLIHQGTDIIPCEFIAALAPDHPYPEHHAMLLANMVAQADALATGRSLEESGGEPQRVFAGNRPSSVLLLDRLDPWHLGLLLALYEHKIFVQGVLWGINSFDQWGVELGKVLAAGNYDVLQDPENERESPLLGVIREALPPAY